MTIVLAVVLAFTLNSGPSTSDGSTPSVLSPLALPGPTPNAATEGPCAQVLSALPVQLGPLAPRVVHPSPDSALVVAWGDPAVVLRCGVARPAQLVPGSGALIIQVGDVNWLPVQEKDDTVFTAIDRAVYVSVTVPKAQDYQPLPLIGQAVASKLPQVCQVEVQGQAPPPTAKLCTRRQ